MRRILLTIATISLLSCGTETSDNQQTTEIPPFVVNPDLVNELFVFDGHDENKNPFSVLESITADLNADGIADKITLFIIDDWGDPGFQKVKFELSDQETYELLNYGGWVTFNDNYAISEEIAAKNQLQSKRMMMINATPTSKLILLFGYVYANDPGLLTIVDPTNGAILFNKNWDLQQITDANSDKFLELHGTSEFDGTTEILDFGSSSLQLQKENRKP